MYHGYGYSAIGGITSVLCDLIIAIIYIVIICIIASKMCEIARLKGYDPAEKHIFALCFWLGIFGILYVLGLPDMKLRKLLGDESITIKEEPSSEKQEIKKEITYLDNGDWRCPMCNAINPVNDKRCYCGYKKQ